MDDNQSIALGVGMLLYGVAGVAYLTVKAAKYFFKKKFGDKHDA